MVSASQRIRLSSQDREKIWGLYKTGTWKVARLAEKFCVSRPTIYKVLARARKGEFSPRKSTNHRYRSIKYGIKRLSRIENGMETISRVRGEHKTIISPEGQVR